MACVPIGDDAKLGTYAQYASLKDDKGCTDPQYMGKTLFFGKDAAKDVPIYVALDFEHYQIARAGMAIAASAAVILGVSLCFVLLRKRRGY
jgi:hypothetical protein